MGGNCDREAECAGGQLQLLVSRLGNLKCNLNASLIYFLHDVHVHEANEKFSLKGQHVQRKGDDPLLLAKCLSKTMNETDALHVTVPSLQLP